MGEVVEGFLAFRRPFLAEAVVVARRRGFDMDEVTGLYDDAEQALDHLLVATMSGHGLARSPRRRVRIPGPGADRRERVAAGIRVVVATAPAVPSAARHRLEAAIVPAAKRHGGAVIRTCHRIEWYRDGAEDPLALLAASRRADPGRTTTVDRGSTPSSG